MVNAKISKNITDRAANIAIAILSLCGIATALYLGFTHYQNYNDLYFQSFCAISPSFNCDTVAQSKYSIFLGAPLAAWGVLAYVFFLVLSLILFSQKKVSTSFFILLIYSLFLSLSSIALAFISKFYIQSYCLLCIIMYAISFALTVTAWLAFNRPKGESLKEKINRDITLLKHHKKNITSLIFTILLLAISLTSFYPKYWEVTLTDANKEVMHGITLEGSPWIGSEHPSLTIVEYTDYLCFQCSKMHQYLRKLIELNPKKIKLIHKNFPLDKEINPAIKETINQNSGRLALFAVIAQQQNLFWPANDALYRHARMSKTINLSNIAKEAGINLSNFEQTITNPQLYIHILRDINSGIHHKIYATPSYVINGKIYTGTFPLELIETTLKNSK